MRDEQTPQDVCGEAKDTEDVYAQAKAAFTGDEAGVGSVTEFISARYFP